MGMEKRHIIGMLVGDRPGVLTRVAGLFSRRGFNIDTITVGKTAKPGVSRMVFTIKGDESILEQVSKQVNKLVDVIKVSELKGEDAIVSELCLVKVGIPNEKSKKEVLRYADIYKVKIADLTPKSVIFRVIGDSAKVDSFLNLVKKFGIKEISRTGVTAMGRGNAKNGDKG
jgi:acetolactate synthase-1/3 small subunit